MEEHGKRMWQTAGLVTGVIGLLGVAASMAPEGPIEILGKEIHMPHIADYLKEEEDSVVDIEGQLRSVEAEMVMTAADSAAAAKADTMAFYERYFASSKGSITYPDSTYEYFFGLYKTLESAGRRTVHILHYGDSQIEGDRITGLIREKMQGEFGGTGPGLIPMWQPIASRAVSQSLSDSVATYYAGGMMGRRASHNRYGAMAQMAEMRGEDVTLRVRAGNAGGFRHIAAYVGHIGEDGLTMTLGADDTRTAESGDAAVSELTWELDKTTREIEIHVKGSGEIYGIELDGGSGVSMTNIPMRGSDGTYFTGMDRQLNRKMMQKLDVKMIIMEFGGNAMPYIRNDDKRDSWLTTFGQQIEAVRQTCPEAKILVIGPADMSERDETGNLRTLEMLPGTVEGMRTLCREKGVAFWDMYRVMGGRNSMVSWVSHEPAWAAPDYVHFTQRGANKIAEVLWEAMRMNYEYYRLKTSE